MKALRRCRFLASIAFCAFGVLAQSLGEDGGSPGFEIHLSRLAKRAEIDRALTSSAGFQRLGPNPAFQFGVSNSPIGKDSRPSSIERASVGQSGQPETAPPSRTVADEAALFAGGRIRAQQHALSRLAAQPDPQADEVLLGQFQRLEAGQLPTALWLELFEAADHRDNAALKARLAERARALARDSDVLARFRECLEGGDAESGRRIFMTKPEAGCIRCHSVDGEGGQIGPELTWLRHSVERLHLLESVIEPNATLATGYAPATLTLAGGEEVSGVVTLETEDDLTITSVVDGRKRHLRTAEIRQRTPLPSPMPPYFGTVLTKREIRDLIEFLAEGD